MAQATFVAIFIAIILVGLQSGSFKLPQGRCHSARHRGKDRNDLSDSDDARSTDLRRDDGGSQSDVRPPRAPDGALKVYDRRQDQLTVAEQLAGRNKSDLTFSSR